MTRSRYKGLQNFDLVYQKLVYICKPIAFLFQFSSHWSALTENIVEYILYISVHSELCGVSANSVWEGISDLKVTFRAGKNGSTYLTDTSTKEKNQF